MTEQETLLRKVATAMREHFLDPADSSYCVCGGWDDSDMNPEDWDEHMADVAMNVIYPKGASDD